MEFNLSNIEHLSLPDCLNIPMSYLFQEFSKEDLTLVKDDSGWGILHWAVAQKNISKIKELISYGFPHDKQSNIARFPEHFIKTNLSSSIPYLYYYSIPFAYKGYTPVHLCVFLQSHYSHLYKQNIKGGHEYSQSETIQRNIYDQFFSDYYYLEDGSGYTVTDYCFLTENITLLQKIIKKDPTLSSLKKIELTTAYDIVEKHKDNIDHNVEIILSQIHKKISFHKLGSSLSHKNNEEEHNIIKI